MNIAVLAVAFAGGFIGLLSTLYLAVSFPTVVLWKIFRSATQGIPLTK